MRQRPIPYLTALTIASLALLTATGLTVTQPAQAQAPDEAVTVFRNARLIPGDGSAPCLVSAPMGQI